MRPTKYVIAQGKDWAYTCDHVGKKTHVEITCRDTSYCDLFRDFPHKGERRLVFEIVKKRKTR